MSDLETADTPEMAPTISFWRSVGEALGGEHRDYTSESLNRAVLLLAVPMVMEMVMESLLALSDVFWVSRLGRDAVAVVGITESIMTIIYAVAFGIAIAGTAFVSRRVGEKNPVAAAHAAGQVIVVGVIFSAAIGLVLGWFAPEILRSMGASEEIVQLGTHYARIMLGGNMTVFMIFLLNAIFRGAGDAVMAMRTLGLANVLNIILCPCFIFGWAFFPHLGVTGAAVSTNIGRAIGVLYQLWHFAGMDGRIKMQWRHLWPDWKVIKSLLRMAGSGVAQLMVNTMSWIGLMKIVALFGSGALAGYTIAMRLIVFALLPAWGLSNTAATLVGQNLGARKPDRAEAAIWLTTRYNAWFLGFFGAIFVFLSGPIIRLFSLDPAVILHGSRALMIIGLSLPLYAAGMCTAAAFNGAGDTWTPTLLNAACFLICEIPLAWLLAVGFGMGPNGVYIAILVAFVLMTVWGIVLVRRGKWKLQTF